MMTDLGSWPSTPTTTTTKRPTRSPATSTAAAEARDAVGRDRRQAAARRRGQGEPLHPEPAVRSRRAPGLRSTTTSAARAPGDDIRAAFGELEPISPAYRHPEAACRAHGRAGHRGLLPVPDARCRHGRGAVARRRGRARRVPRVQRVDARRLDVQLPRPHLRGAVLHAAWTPTARVAGSRVGARAGRAGDRDALRARCAARTSRARRATPCTTRSGPGSTRPASSSRTTRATRATTATRPTGARRTRWRRSGTTRSAAAHRWPSPDLRHDRRARLPRRVHAPPEPAGRDDRERFRLGRRTSYAASRRLRAAAERVRRRRSGRSSCARTCGSRRTTRTTLTELRDTHRRRAHHLRLRLPARRRARRSRELRERPAGLRRRRDPPHHARQRARALEAPTRLGS